MPARDDAPDPLGRLKASVGEVRRLLQRQGGTEYAQTLGLIQATIEALDATTAALRARDVDSSPAASARLAAWLHDLRDPVTAMAGWAQILNGLDLKEDARRRRAQESIERNARLVERLLTNPPS